MGIIRIQGADENLRVHKKPKGCVFRRGSQRRWRRRNRSRQRAGSESSVSGQGRMSSRDAKSSVQEKLPTEAEHRAA